MGRTELGDGAALAVVAAIGPGVVAAQDPVELRPQDLDPHIGTRVGSIWNGVYGPARKHPVQCRWPHRLCPVSSTLSRACSGRSGSDSS